ncbi:sigma-70 family RNA polymerase sigma factor [Amycolatopsis sp. K13G38]|uniref:Sigma-70 family RNA polymerase sigma factor n=1 Tax=Amycolatopsis acididurans TaxID=2724524 RepID=A0ABX1JEP2_9PSEU|nr:sigma-70 family RNA polymerase sigma factor [Amycolatopsis acididurans]NKQ56860.1 sigma-70 family RNA polymerase sigma factor [Amycolatopsis acididurans]
MKRTSTWARNRAAVAEEALIRALYEEHGRALLAYATRLMNDRAAAEDVVQETLVRAWRHPDALVNGKGSVRGWLLTVTRNIVTDRYRARAARPAEVAETPVTTAVAADHADSVVTSMIVLEALDKLSPEHRDVLTQIYFRGRSVAEAAATLGVPQGTVKSRSYYALRAMRQAFGGGRQVALEEVSA